MKKFSVVSKDLSPVRSLAQFLMDIGVSGPIAIQAHDGGYQRIPLNQLDEMVLTQSIVLYDEKVVSSSRDQAGVELYIKGERFKLNAATWDTFLGEVELTIARTTMPYGSKYLTIPACRNAIVGGNDGLRPGTRAWWVMAPKLLPHEHYD